ncbi:hypothetical protein [Streptomyces sp. NBC_01233]|uniref:hypothetical protein n=1 Tax=Streptomyces sp. NBC_01233 TaxID=2903787 RepID=UPI002E119C27|nr:hypothetical protein OG332_24145 [Streptomyces sp. NBC_01233]
MTTTVKTAQMMARLADAETAAKVAGREETRTATRATRAAARLTDARTALATARRELRTATRTGKGQAAAARRVERLTEKVATLAAAAKDARAEATAARRAARTADRRLDRLAGRAARSAARTVGEIAERLGRTALAPAATADQILPAEELPAVEEIEEHGDRFAELDAKAKQYAKAAEVEKKWLRQLPVGTFGRVTVARVPGGSVLDGDQVALDYADQGLIPPRKARKDTFKAAVTAAPVLVLAPAA